MRRLRGKQDERCTPIAFCLVHRGLRGGPCANGGRKSAGRSVEPVRQIELSEEKITHYLAARLAFDEILAKAAAVPEPGYVRLLNETARKNGFADYADYESVAINVVWILTGIDPLSKKYVGVQTVTKQEAAILLSDKALSPRDHRSRFDTLHAQMLTAAPTKFAGQYCAGDEILRQAFHVGCVEGLVACPRALLVVIPAIVVISAVIAGRNLAGATSRLRDRLRNRLNRLKDRFARGAQIGDIGCMQAATRSLSGIYAPQRRNASGVQASFCASLTSNARAPIEKLDASPTARARPAPRAAFLLRKKLICARMEIPLRCDPVDRPASAIPILTRWVHPGSFR